MKYSMFVMLDRFLGSTLCFLLSFFNLFRIKKNRSYSEEKNILFIQLSELGAIVLASPTLKRIKELYPDVKLHYITFDLHKPIFDLFDDISFAGIYTINTTGFYKFVTDLGKVIHILLSKHFDVIFDFEFFSRFSALLTGLSSAPAKLGFSHKDTYRGNFYTHQILFKPNTHVSELFYSFLEIYNSELKKVCDEFDRDITSVLTLPNLKSSGFSEKDSVVAKIKKNGASFRNYILIHAHTGKLKLRDWGKSNFVEFTKKLLDMFGESEVYLIGNSDAVCFNEEICRGVGSKRCFNFSRIFSLSELRVLFSETLFFFGVDGGLSHIASLMGAKKVYVLFGPETPDVFGPLGSNVECFYADLECSPCFTLVNYRCSCCKDNICLSSIKSDLVLNKICLNKLK